MTHAVQTATHPFAEQLRFLSAEVDKVKELHGIIDDVASQAGKLLRRIQHVKN